MITGMLKFVLRGQNKSIDRHSSIQTLDGRTENINFTNDVNIN